VIEKPLPQPETIEADFDAHYGGSGDKGGSSAAAPTPAE
jgi:ubiquinol-cytochrome c reductase cytochrome b subunit